MNKAQFEGAFATGWRMAMVLVPRPEDFAPYIALPRPAENAAPKRGIWRRFLDALVARRQRQIEGDVARLIARRGGRLTDDLEREIMRNIFTSNWRIDA
jgi:hypothetical protein